MEKIFSAAEKLADTLHQYADTRIESVKLSVAEKSSAAIANMAAAFFVAMILAFFFLFAGIAAALALAPVVGSYWLAFLLMAVLWLLIGFVVWKARQRLIRLPVMNAMLRLFFNDHEKDQ